VGIAGQGVTTPGEKAFADHGVVIYGEKLYDPSYGLPHAGLREWEDESIDAFGSMLVIIVDGVARRLAEENEPATLKTKMEKWK